MTSKARKLAFKARVAAVARVVACTSFLVLTIIGVSSLVRAMSLENIANENGIPATWEVGSVGNPDTIEVPMTYWDQKVDACDDPNRQFEWVECGYWTAGAMQGLVKNHLGTDGLPIPAFTNQADAWATNHDAFTMNITGQDPVQPNDNFYRWFHEVPDKSKRVDGHSVTFKRIGEKTYTYGGQNIFPVDDQAGFGGDDTKRDGVDGKQHNFHFTAHLGFSVKIDANGSELFEFSGDDDVWVYLNDQLVLDIGGLHEAIYGWFRINDDGTLTTYVEKVNNTALRTEELTACMKNPHGDFNSCTGPFNDVIRPSLKSVEVKTLDIGLKANDIVDLDFFYAERSTTESNTKITITNMNWPISADSTLDGEVVGKVEDTNRRIVKYNTSITNRDPSYPLDLIKLAAYIEEQPEAEDKKRGFLPLSISTLEYTTTPSNKDSWQSVEISNPTGTLEGFTLKNSIRMSPYGSAGDTLYFRFYAETSNALYGKVDCLTSYYTELGGASGITYDHATVDYGDPNTPPTPPDPPVEETYTVKVKYLYVDGSEASPERSQEGLKTGDDFSFISPEIPGFTPDKNMVNGVIENSDLTYEVIYSPKTEELYNVNIYYVYENGDEAYKTFTGSYKPNQFFSVDSPAIEGYTPNKTNISDTVVDHDLNYTVVYKAVPDEPTPPVGPTDPDTPTEPENPVTPEKPTDQVVTGPLLPNDGLLGDASLIYLDPLGAVAFVPNTGVVTDAVAALFNESFAEVILSQGFVMGVLLIFAGSFAIYFSLRDASKANEARKQRALARAAVAPRSSAKTTKKAPKSQKNVKQAPKTVKSALKLNSKKTAKPVAKSTRKSR